MEQNVQHSQEEKIMEQNAQPSEASSSRRSFLRKGLAVGGAGTIGAGLLTNGLSFPVFAEEGSGSFTKGDVAILRLLAAIEIIETDLWRQYNELGGIQDHEVPGGAGVPPTSRPFKCSMGTCPSISTTIPRMRSATSRSSTHTWLRRARIQSIWIGFARCRAVERQAPNRSDGSPTSCSSAWTPVGGLGTAAARRTLIWVTRPLKPSRV